MAAIKFKEETFSDVQKSSRLFFFFFFISLKVDY
jgi:hypothetical protein